MHRGDVDVDIDGVRFEALGFLNKRPGRSVRFPGHAAGRLVRTPTNSEFQHPSDALSHCRDHGCLVASGPALETMVFDCFNSKNIGHTFV